MTKILICGDIHVRDTPPANCYDTYTDDIIEMLKWTAKAAAEMGCDAVAWSGDVFDHKAPSKNSHALVLKMVGVVRAYQEAGVPLWIAAGNHDLCVPEDTEALTDQGWKHVYELDGTEKFATLNKESGALEFQTPSSIRHMPYAGTGYHFKTESIDMVTTPNHGWWGAWRTGKPLRRKTSAELAVGSIGWRLPAVQSWEGVSPETVKVGTYEIETGLAARLFGWYVSEGTADRSASRIAISQSVDVNPEHYAEIESILVSAGLPYSKSEKMIRVNDRSVAEFFIEHFGYAGSKDMRLPRWLLNWNKEELEQFLFAYFRGDGTINGSVETRNQADYYSASVVARTANRALADDLSEVGVRLGYRMRLSIEKEFAFGDSGYVGHAYEQGFNQTANITLPKPTSVELDEMVWCPTLPNETWLARRNGKMAWTGNSNDRLESIHEKQPLGVLYAAGAGELVGWHPELPLYGAPWRQDWERDLEAAFASYRLDPWRFGSDKTKTLAITHMSLFPPALVGNVPYEHIPAEKVAKAMGNEGSLYYGHIHDYHGVFMVDGVTFANMGAMSRGSLTESNTNRKIKVALWTDGADEVITLPDGRQVTTLGEPGFIEIDVPHKPASEVFRLEQAKASKDTKQVLDSFVAAIGSASLEISSVASVIDHVRDLDVSSRVKNLVVELLEEQA